jgi:glutaryl-CoA dehydrogenase
MADSTGTDAAGLELLALDSRLTAEELRLRDEARDFARRRLFPFVDGWFEDAYFPIELAAELGRLGVLGGTLSGYGCPGRGAVAYGLQCMELEAADSGIRTFASVQGSLTMSAIHRFGSEKQKRRWLPGLASGEVIGCFALTEPLHGSDPASMETAAELTGHEWVLNGVKRWIGNGSLADVAVVWARTEGGIRGFLVPRQTDGFSAEDITRKWSMRASVQSELRFDNCRVLHDAVLPRAEGLKAPLSCLNEARYGIVWGAMGAARSCYEAAVSHARKRIQFGRPIASFQLVQERLVDMLSEILKGTLLALHLGRLKEQAELRPEQVSIGKLSNTKQALYIAREARALLGGEGITLEHPVVRHMNNLEAVLTYEGTPEIHTLIVGQAITGERAFT